MHSAEVTSSVRAQARSSQARHAAQFIFTALVLVGCTGTTDGPSDNANAGGDGVGGESGNGGGGTDGTLDPDLPSFKAAPANLRALTRMEYRNSVRDLLGISASAEVDEISSQAGFSSVGAANGTFSTNAVDKFQTAGFATARDLFKNVALRKTFVGCEPTQPSDPCIQTFVRRFGLSAFRRPLSDEEAKKYTELVKTVGTDFGSAWVGLEYALAAFLQSPAFLYRVELGEPDPDNKSRLRYTSYEMASRLSYFFWATTPDEPLLAAAERGELTKATKIEEQATRLLSDARARPALLRLFLELYRLDELDGVQKDATVYPSFSPALVASMKGEVERTVEDLVFERKADLRELFDNRTTFIDANLAKLYGLTAPASGFAKVALPEDGTRSGILGFAALLAHRGKETRSSPTLRGKYVREELLCQHVAPAPADVDTRIPEAAPNQNITTRQRLTDHLTKPQCRSCHLITDPIGFGLENFDGIGAYRATERTLTIDASGELDGTAFKDARGLGKALKENPDAESCLVRQIYRFVTSHVDTDGEGRVIASLTKKFAETDHKFADLVKAIASSDGFRFATANP